MPKWFGPKTVGYGIGPRSWQGWVATAIVLAVVIGAQFIPYRAVGLPYWTRAVISVAAVVVYVALVCLTYEPD
jgi:hypothetical protein